ncbi:M91 family zinc metallopeptidase [Pseudomonas sp. MPB23]|uniref:M91 family zinc metallopeptidase n=1 Tax=Pseudomonas sp. MPB23 TaxID=3388490 RepID=UPI0039849948
MQLPLIHSTASYNDNTPRRKIHDKPPPSPYTPPTDLTPGIVNRRTHVLHVDGDVKINRVVDWDPTNPQNPEILASWLSVETGDRADHVHVRNWPGGKLQILINGKSHLFDINTPQDRKQQLWIDTKGGDDRVIIDDDVTLPVSVDGGDGNDYLQAGGGRTKLYGGRGNDILRLGSGLGYAVGNDDNDILIGGSGNAVMYGSKGKDLLIAGCGPATQQSYLDGGEDDDVLISGNGHTVSHGGKGNDLLVGKHAGRTTFYTGKGLDEIWNNQCQDRIYAGATDHFDRTKGSAFTEVKPSNAGRQGFKAEAAPGATVEQEQEFKQRVSDDLEFLRSSPIGQQALSKMDELAVTNGGKVTIRQDGNGNTGYLFDSSALDNVPLTEDGDQVIRTDEFIKQGVAGTRADRATITYDPSSFLENADRTHTIAPVTALFHEMAHAYNGATGTFLEGETTEQLGAGQSAVVNNFERQAVGLPSDATPFDLDNDPSTPPSTVNPKAFTENALNQEMGKPLRNAYSFETSEQGDGT